MFSLRIPLKRKSTQPLYEQLRVGLEEAITTGDLPAGTRLPAERDFARQHGLSRTTVTTAYRELEARGLVRSHVGRGTFVSSLPESAHAPFAWRGKISTATQRREAFAMRHLMTNPGRADLISFAAGFPAVECFPVEEFRHLNDYVLKHHASTITRLAAAEGQPQLRTMIGRRFNERAERILILSGATQGLDLIARCLLDPGDVVVMDRPGYVGAIQIFRAAGANLHGWDMRHGDMTELEDLILRYRPKFIYTNPTFQNPSGHTLGERERRELLGLAAQYRIPVVEDDPYGEGYLDEAPPNSLYRMDTNDLVIHLSTFAKVLAPGLRLGWITAAEYIVDQLALIKQRATLFTEGLGQLVMAEFIRSGSYDGHLAVIRKEHRIRRDALLKAMQEHLPPKSLVGAKPAGGIYFWGRLGGGLNSRELLEKAVAAGVAFATGDIFYPDDAGHEQLRICFASGTPQQIEEGIKRLARSFEATTPGRSRSKIPIV